MRPDLTRDALPAGKLPPELLDRLLTNVRRADPRVLVGPGVGEDAALIDFGDTILVAKSDPVTFATDEIGWYAVQVNANDVACRGADPRWFLATVLLPEGTVPAEVERIFDQLAGACDALGVTMVGGHTEMTLGLPRPIIAGTMLGEVTRGAEVTTGGARPGDRVILAGGIAIEGTSILAREARPMLERAGVDSAVIERAADFLRSPGISVVRAARAAHATGRVTAMHDPTEGGLAAALAELAVASGAGVAIDADAVPVYDECATICEALGVDAWGLIASGALLITAQPQHATEVIAAAVATGVKAIDIGEMTRGENGRTMRSGGVVSPLPVFARDELARALGG